MNNMTTLNSGSYILPGIVPDSNLTYLQLKRTVCDAFGTSIDLIHSKTRIREICITRQVCMFLGRTVLKMTLKDAAISFRMDHATAAHSITVVSNLYRYDKEFRVKMQSVLSSIGVDHSKSKYLSC